MLNETTIATLSRLTYRPDAKREVCALPLAGIYDRIQIFRLYGIRPQIWKGEALPDKDQKFWDSMQSLVPRWAFFQRQRVSLDDLRAQEQAEQATAEGLEAWFADADEVRISETDGVQSLSVTFDLTKEQGSVQKKGMSWWERIFHHRRLTKR
jgi:hypothetical protein